MNRPVCAGFIIITGSPASGKSHLLTQWTARLRRRWQVCGIESHPQTTRKVGSNTVADSYPVRVIGTNKTWPWAILRPGTLERDYPEPTRQAVIKLLRPSLSVSDVCVFEDLGLQELQGAGFAELVDEAMAITHLWVIASAKKATLPAVLERFSHPNTLVLDVDHHPDSEEIFVFLERELTSRLSARIGTCAGMGGLIEIGLGSALHTARIPLKGHFLAYLQTIMMVSFGRLLRGRGLFRIGTLMAMLKAFSPAGNTVRPMIYIALQAWMFSLPALLLGWHLVSALFGAVLLNTFTLALSLAIDTILLGRTFLTAFGQLINTVGALFGFSFQSWQTGLIFLFIIKAAVALLVAVAAWYFDFSTLLTRIGKKTNWMRLRPTVQASTWRSSLRNALRDLVRPAFVLGFFLSILIVWFFARLRSDELVFLVLRGVSIALLGFTLLRRIDVFSLQKALSKRFSPTMAVALAQAIQMLNTSSSPQANSYPSLLDAAENPPINKNATGASVSMGNGNSP